MNLDTRYVFGIVAIICFTGLQLAAWYMGIDGQVFTFTTSAITSIIAFLIGLDILPPYAKQQLDRTTKAIETFAQNVRTQN